ncbi:MAG: CPXCG motif-containing cysteine-rich protein [Candidatus Korobacteraceae bacterium]
MRAEFQCSYCGEWNQTNVDESAGGVQSYVEDCQTCCQPNTLVVRLNKRERQFVIQAQRES